MLVHSSSEMVPLLACWLWNKKKKNGPSAVPVAVGPLRSHPNIPCLCSLSALLSPHGRTDGRRRPGRSDCVPSPLGAAGPAGGSGPRPAHAPRRRRKKPRPPLGAAGLTSGQQPASQSLRLVSSISTVALAQVEERGERRLVTNTIFIYL